MENKTMSRRQVIAGNWKMNKGVAEAVALATDLRTALADNTSADLVVCPTFTSLAAVVDVLADSNIAVGAQNVHWADSGAFTAEISADMLLEIRVKYAIIGHSERRQYFGETDETVNLRLKAALAVGLTPIMCVGETLAQRESGQTESVVSGQIAGGLADLGSEDLARMLLAYEPVWAIGTGLTATPEQANDVHAAIRTQIGDAFGAVAGGVRILYGGSVKPGNASELLSQEHIDGALVGGASLKADDFAGIAACVC